MKRATIVDSAREVWGLVRREGEESKECLVELCRKEVLQTRDEVAKQGCMEVYKEEKRKVKRYTYQNKK